MSNVSKIISPWPSALRDDEVCNNADANSEIFATLAGRNRWIQEMLTGEFDGNEAPISPKNPQGQHGVDNSGPPYGPAIRHSVGYLGGGMTTAHSYASDLSGVRIATLNVTSRGILMSTEPWQYMIPVYNKPYSPYRRAPHSRARLDFLISNDNTNSVEVYIKVGCQGRSVVISEPGGSAMVIPAATAALVSQDVPYQQEEALAGQINLISGSNEAYVEVYTDEPASAPTYSTGVWLVNHSLSRYGKTDYHVDL